MGYDCTIEDIKNIEGKNYFILKWEQADVVGTMPIQVDQPAELIRSRMKEIVDGKRDKLYLTRGMRDIDVSYIGDNKWQLFDEFNIYEFEMDVTKEKITNTELEKESESSLELE